MKKLVHVNRGLNEYIYWKVTATEEEKKKLLDYVFKREPRVAKVGRYSFKKPPSHNTLEHGNVNLNSLLPELTCKHCGKTFCLRYGQKRSEYQYRCRKQGAKGTTYLYFCSWTCYSRWQKENKAAKKRLTKEI